MQRPLGRWVEIYTETLRNLRWETKAVFVALVMKCNDFGEVRIGGGLTERDPGHYDKLAEGTGIPTNVLRSRLQTLVRVGVFRYQDTAFGQVLHYVEDDREHTRLEQEEDCAPEPVAVVSPEPVVRPKSAAERMAASRARKRHSSQSSDVSENEQDASLDAIDSSAKKNATVGARPRPVRGRGRPRKDASQPVDVEPLDEIVEESESDPFEHVRRYEEARRKRPLWERTVAKQTKLSELTPEQLLEHKRAQKRVHDRDRKAAIRARNLRMETVRDPALMDKPFYFRPRKIELAPIVLDESVIPKPRPLEITDAPQVIEVSKEPVKRFSTVEGYDGEVELLPPVYGTFPRKEPTADLPELPQSSRTYGTARFELPYLVQAYEDAVRAVTRHTYKVPHLQMRILGDTVDGHAPVGDISKRVTWLKNAVPHFAVTVDAEAIKYRYGYDPRAFLAWCNSGELHKVIAEQKEIDARREQDLIKYQAEQEQKEKDQLENREAERERKKKRKAIDMKLSTKRSTLETLEILLHDALNNPDSIAGSPDDLSKRIEDLRASIDELEAEAKNVGWTHSAS